MKGPRLTPETGLILSALLEEPSGELFGREITTRTGLASGSISPILQRLEDRSWLESRWEDPSEAAADKRPRRRYYRLTGLGRSEAPSYCNAVVAKFSARLQAFPDVLIQRVTS